MSDRAPNTNNYLVGKGKVYFDRLNANGIATGERDLGNDPIFALTPTNEKLDHYSSMSGVKTKDLIAIISSDMALKFTLDEININNLCIALFGDEVDYYTQGDGNVADAAVNAALGRWRKLVYRNLVAGSVVVTGPAGAPVYQVGVDYTVDATIGRIRANIGGAIAEGEALEVDYTYQAISIPRVIPSTRARVEGLLRFVGDATYGYDFEVVIWKASLEVSGDINFISDEWAQLEFVGDALNDAVAHPGFPYGYVLDPEGIVSIGS